MGILIDYIEAQPGLQPRWLAAVRARASLLSLLYRYNCPYWGKLTLAAHTGHREGNAHRTDEEAVQRRHARLYAHAEPIAVEWILRGMLHYGRSVSEHGISTPPSVTQWSRKR